MPSGYSSREDPGQMKKNKQSMADLKLRRLTELNTRLREDLERERISVSQASKVRGWHIGTRAIVGHGIGVERQPCLSALKSGVGASS